jgi:hypothetical protein
VPLPGQPYLLCLVTDAADDPGQIAREAAQDYRGGNIERSTE